MNNASKKLLHNRNIIAALGTIFGSTIYCIAIVFILDKGSFYAGGITGISQIIANLVGIPEIKSIIITAMNIPLFIMGWKSVSKRFAIFSLISVIYQSVLIYFLTILLKNGVDPFSYFDPFTVDPATNVTTIDAGKLVVLSIIGGILCGVGCGVVLRCGSSTGGMDIISQTIQMKGGIPFIMISTIVDFLIIIAGTIVGYFQGLGITAGVFTIIRFIIQAITVDKVYTIYKYQKVTIVTEKYDEIRAALIKAFPHGITILKAVGGYSNTQKTVLETVILTYELDEYKHIIKSIDPDAFTYYTSVKGVMGKYIRKSIA